MDDGGDDLERRLREVLRSQRLSISPDPHALSRVRERARRRQRRRALANGAAALAVVAVVGSAVALRPHGAGPAVVGDHQLTSSAFASSPAASDAVSPSPSAAIVPSVAASDAVELPGVEASPTSISSTDPTTAPTRFDALSVSAISTDNWWVLGYSTTTYADETASEGFLARTTDGGGHFTIGRPDLPIANPQMRPPPGAMFVSSIRFGNPDAGWAFGPALYSTTDGGTSWSPEPGIVGAVVDLVAADDVAWAVVDLSQPGMPTPPPSVGPDARYAIYSTAYGDAVQHWTRVRLPFELGATQPSLVDQDGTVTMLAAGPPTTSDHDHVLIALPGKTFSDHVGPCSQGLGGSLSSSKEAVWAACRDGTSEHLAVSTDRGASWRSTSEHFGDSEAGGLGAIDDRTAIVYNVATNGLTRLSADGGRVELPNAVGGDATRSSFIGFTNPATGFAVVDEHDGSNLWRTTDGGLHWNAVTIGP